jgi:MinD superfamily P-loop ATPase
MDKPFEIVVLSGKGGTGKTSITAAFAVLCGNAVITDCDVDAADLHLLLSPEIYKSENFSSGAKAEIDRDKCTACGLCMEFCRFGAIEFRNHGYCIDHYACEGCGLCVEVCPAGAMNIEKHENNRIYFSNSRCGPMIYGKLGIAEDNSGKLVSQIRHYAKETATSTNARYILTDGPPGIGCPVISSVTGSDLIIAVTEPTQSGWHDLKRLIDMVGRFKTPLSVIINKYDLNENMTISIEKKLKDKGIQVSGKIPYDETMILALLEGKTINEFKPEGTVTYELNRIWETIKTTVYEPKSI